MPRSGTSLPQQNASPEHGSSESLRVEDVASGGLASGPASSASGSLAEEWRKIPGINERYEVSNLGRARSWVGWRGRGWRESPRPMDPKIHWTHKVIRIDGRTRYLHHLVLEAFVGPRPRGQVGRHLNDLPEDNRLSNLAWGTRAQNVEDGKRNGRVYGTPGESHPKAKINEAQVRAIRAWRTYGFEGKEIGSWYGISSGLVYNIAKGKRWGHVEG